MPTALDLIESALGKIGMFGAGETLSAADSAIGVKRQNALTDEWLNDNLIAYTTTDTIATLPASTVSRTIGPSQQINVARPTRILPGSFSRIGDIDYPLTPISEPEYNLISLKSSIGSIAPSVCFYDGGSPTGTVSFWPTASQSVELHLITPNPNSVAVDSTTSFVFPPGYQRAIEFALACELAPDFDAVPSAFVMSAAANAKRKLRRANGYTPQLDMGRIGGKGNSPSDFYGGYQ